MAGDLYSRAFGSLAPGTVTSDVYDFSSYQVVEIMARAGTQTGVGVGTATVYLDVQDLDGSWYNAVGSLGVPGTSMQTLAMARGMSVGAANPKALGIAQRVRVVSQGTLEFGINVVGF